jgi:hypothetical protein
MILGYDGANCQLRLEQKASSMTIVPARSVTSRLNAMADD